MPAGLDKSSIGMGRPNEIMNYFSSILIVERDKSAYRIQSLSESIQVLALKLGNLSFCSWLAVQHCLISVIRVGQWVAPEELQSIVGTVPRSKYTWFCPPDRAENKRWPSQIPQFRSTLNWKWVFWGFIAGDTLTLNRWWIWFGQWKNGTKINNSFIKMSEIELKSLE